MTDVYLNGEPMIWMSVTEDEFGDYVLWHRLSLMIT